MTGECVHDLAERETACADGMCPICLAAQLDVAKSQHELDKNLRELNLDGAKRLIAELAKANATLEAVRETCSEWKYSHFAKHVLALLPRK